MSPAGRPPKPTELKRRNGNPGQRRLPTPVVLLPGGQGTPEPPSNLGPIALNRWPLIWETAQDWLNPGLDGPQVETICRLYDEISELRKLLEVHGHLISEPIMTPKGPAIDPTSGEIVTKLVANPASRLLRAAEKQLQGWLSDLGFSPTARARLGLAEVKRQTTLETLLAQRANRNSG